jgi:hypothetical protein
MSSELYEIKWYAVANQHRAGQRGQLNQVPKMAQTPTCSGRLVSISFAHYQGPDRVPCVKASRPGPA